MLLWIWVLIGVIALIAIAFFAYYNRFIVLGNRIDNALSQINVQLKRRAELIPNLIETVKGFAKHEKEAIKAVTDARKALMGAEGLEAKMKADTKLETALKSIFALAEAYPNLKSNTNFLELQKELSATEDKVAYARQYYNDSVMSYNNLCQIFPGNIVAAILGKKKEDYLQIEEKQKEPVKVKF